MPLQKGAPWSGGFLVGWRTAQPVSMPHLFNQGGFCLTGVREDVTEGKTRGMERTPAPSPDSVAEGPLGAKGGGQGLGGRPRPGGRGGVGNDVAVCSRAQNLPSGGFSASSQIRSDDIVHLHNPHAPPRATPPAMNE